jgi:hypothetical protein
MRVGPASSANKGAIGHPFLLLAAVWLVALAALGAWTLHAGKDLSWDVLNHHVYLPFSLTSGHYASDLLAAGPQSTQHPLGYLPFWALLSADLPAWVIGAVLVLVHAAMAVPMAHIAIALWPAAMPGMLWWRALALALALLAPSLLLVVGTSSSDPLSALAVLWALSLALPARQSLRGAMLAGALLGLAVVIKPSNAVFAIAIFGAWLARAAAWRQALSLGVACTLVTLLLQAPWSWWLQREFASPLYPLFNQIFQSPHAPLEAILSSRYVPQAAVDWLLRPFELAQPRRLTHTEALAPDLRPALCVLALALAASAAALGRLRDPRPADPPAPPPDRELLVFTALAYVLWMMSSGNSRYALPLFMVIGLVATRGLQLALPAGMARVLLGLAVVLQAAYYFELGTRRFDAPVAWDSGPYVDARVPSRLREQAALHLSLGTPSFAVFAPWLARNGAFVNAISTMSLPDDGPLGAKLQQRLKAFEGRTRVLFKGRPPLADNERAARARASYDRSVYRFGLVVDWGDCETLALRTPIPGSAGRVAADPALPSSVPAIVVSSCAARTHTGMDPDYATDKAFAERVFAIVEAACPRVFGPPPMATNADLGAWHRHYVNSDARLLVSPADGVFVSHFSVLRSGRLGSVNEVLRGAGVAPCAAWAGLTAP